MTGIVYALISVIMIPFIALALVLSALGQQASSNVNIGAEIAGAVIFAILAPLIYGVLGFLFGMLTAWIYNVVAKWTGGIEFEVE